MIAICTDVPAATSVTPGAPDPSLLERLSLPRIDDGAANGYASGLGCRGSHGVRTQQNSLASESAMIQSVSLGSFST